MEDATVKVVTTEMDSFVLDIDDNTILKYNNIFIADLLIKYNNK